MSPRVAGREGARGSKPTSPLSPGVTVTFAPALSALAFPAQPALRPLEGAAQPCTQGSFRSCVFPSKGCPTRHRGLWQLVDRSSRRTCTRERVQPWRGLRAVGTCSGASQCSVAVGDCCHGPTQKQACVT